MIRRLWLFLSLGWAALFLLALVSFGQPLLSLSADDWMTYLVVAFGPFVIGSLIPSLLRWIVRGDPRPHKPAPRYYRGPDV